MVVRMCRLYQTNAVSDLASWGVGSTWEGRRPHGGCGWGSLTHGKWRLSLQPSPRGHTPQSFPVCLSLASLELSPLHRSPGECLQAKESVRRPVKMASGLRPPLSHRAGWTVLAVITAGCFGDSFLTQCPVGLGSLPFRGVVPPALSPAEVCGQPDLRLHPYWQYGFGLVRLFS